MMEAAALLLATASFSALALALPKHHRDFFGAPPSRGRAAALQAAGWTLLAVSLAPCVARSDGSLGLVLWFGLLTAAALVVALSLSYAACCRFGGHRAKVFQGTGGCRQLARLSGQGQQDSRHDGS